MKRLTSAALLSGAAYASLCAYIVNQLVCAKPLKLPKAVNKLIAGSDAPEKFDGLCGASRRNDGDFDIQRLEIKTTDGERLCAKLLVPDKPCERIVVACHGARSSALGEFSPMLDYFYNSSTAVLMPEHRGCTISSGKFMGYGTHESRDTLLWTDFARRNLPSADIFLLGVSMGAASVLMASPEAGRHGVSGIVADCSYTSAWEEFAYQLKKSFGLGEFPLLYTCDLFCRLYAGYSFKDASPLSAVSSAEVPILFIHGEDDDFVPFYMMKKLSDACSSEHYTLGIEGAVHARSFVKNPERYTAALESFWNKCKGRKRF